MLTHIVFFKLNDRSTANVARAVERLKSLDGRIPELRSLEVGSDVVKKDRSYDIALVARFDSLDGLNAYAVHPYHVEVADYIKSASSAVASVDYES